VRYLDTSSLVALYYPEEKTEPLVAHLRTRASPLAFTRLHELEFSNGLQLKLFRKEATVSAVAACIETLRGDAESGVLYRVHPAWPAVFATAMRLSATHSRTLGTRTLDLLHVAAALSLQATEFVTGDDRQARAAAKERLKVVRI
jgi:predicted nucleic acid-binding protein